MTLKILVSLIFLAFVILIVLNILKIIEAGKKANLSGSDFKKVVKRRSGLILLLIFLLTLSMFLIFFINYIVSSPLG